MSCFPWMQPWLSKDARRVSLPQKPEPADANEDASRERQIIIRINWSWRAVQNAPDLLPEYDATFRFVPKDVARLRRAFGRRSAQNRDVIVQLANGDEVPMRLILGVDAEKRVQQAEAERAAEAEKWPHLTVSTVFEDGLFDNRLNMAKG
jgi:hypothetical protein